MENDNFDQLNDIEQQEEPEPQQNPLDAMSEEERQVYIIEKMKLKNKLLRYKELFPHLLQNFNYRIEDLDRLEIKELQYLLEEISIAVNTRNSSGLTKILYFESLRVVEIGSRFVGLKIDGLQEALKQNQAIHDCLNEISLKYENDMYMSPEVRLAYLTSTTILGLHKLNSTKNVIDTFLNDKIPEKIAEEYNDL